ncbi:MAG: zinc ribbon domain-containing protein [Acidobacteria bacterium]|nr:zinc ribbon domain-containing protein [Acidobacteriota bacterium]
MPIYEYKCLDCGTHLEKMQKVSDEPLKICESCGGPLEKQWSRSGFQFKGEGWYVTDYANKKSGKAEKSSSRGSTAGTESASKEKSDGPAKDASSKKD